MVFTNPGGHTAGEIRGRSENVIPALDSRLEYLELHRRRVGHLSVQTRLRASHGTLLVVQKVDRMLMNILPINHNLGGNRRFKS